MRSILRSFRDLLWVNRGSILIFEIVYRIFSAFVLIEAAGHGLSFALKRSGFSYLTAGNTLRFFASPSTLMVLTGFLLLCLFFANLEVCVLYTIFQAGAAKERVSALKFLFFGIRNLIELFQTGNIRVLFLNVNYYLLTEGWIFMRLVSHIRPLNYMMTGLLSSHIAQAFLWLLLAVMFCTTVLYLFVPAVSVLLDLRFGDSRKKSRELLQKKWLKIAVFLAGVNLFSWLLYLTSQFILKVLAAFLVALFADRTIELALVLTINRGIDIAVLVVVLAVSSCLNTGALTFLLYRYADRKYLLEIPPYRYSFSAGVRKTFTILLAACLTFSGTLYVYDRIHSGVIAAARATFSEAKITSHRGNSFEAPENTLPAIEAAIDSMSDYVEIDVQETKDDVVVVYHDASLKRITGVRGRLWEYTYGELLLMDFGGWFSEEFTGTSIPTLAEVLNVCQGQINMNIELKADHYSDTLVEETLKLIEEYGMESQVVVSSTSYRYLKEVKELNPDIETGYILTAAYGTYFEDENIDFFSIRSGFVTERLVESAHAYGKKVHAWTVNTRGELNRMKRLQVDNIITDRPVLAREVLYREEGAENLLEFIRLALRMEK
ncbi:MAG: hypothetical protein HFI63_08735 [Lachnospiraceae bacterium]|nr:hypothetical protein [Lachnospiraceae bacterium]